MILQIKIYIILISIILMFLTNTIVFAEEIHVVQETQIAILDNPNGWAPTINPNPVIKEKGANIAGIIQVVGASVAVITLMIIGIRYIIGSAEDRAEYKKTMWPYILGAVIVFAISTLLNILYNVVDTTIN